jgi:thymidylate synthase (FAD)
MSQDKIMQGSDEKIVSNLIERKHGAMLEHGTVYLKMPIAIRYSKDINIYKNSNYCKVVEGDKFIEKDIYGEKVRCWYITTNYRFILENNLLQDLKELQCEPTEFHQKRISVKFICDRGISHELVRHRVFSFAQESTRYCNYSKDKFENQLTFIIPSWLNLEEGIYEMYWHVIDGVGYWWQFNGTEHLALNEEYDSYLSTMAKSEKSYLILLKNGWTPQQARVVLPHSLKTELVMTGFASDWEGFFKLRDAATAHPQMRELAEPLHAEFLKQNLI